jgi:hypothetical protein
MAIISEDLNCCQLSTGRNGKVGTNTLSWSRHIPSEMTGDNPEYNAGQSNKSS